MIYVRPCISIRVQKNFLVQILRKINRLRMEDGSEVILKHMKGHRYERIRDFKKVLRGLLD